MPPAFNIGESIEVRLFKWPRRPTGVAHERFLGRDKHGVWLGVSRGDSFWTPDAMRGGVFEQTLVKVIPDGAYWTACFQDIEPSIDVDIVYPVSWNGSILDEIDLELDVLRYTNGRVLVRDHDKFEQVRLREQLPDEVTKQAESACARVRQFVEEGIEPFGTAGRDWLARFSKT